MITRIELTNFMSHAHTVIEPAAGLTVLVGPNNVGKSAVVAALQILCHNENSTYVLRHGTKQCSVKVETDDGHTIEWRRKNSPSYVIDGQTFDRLKGSGLPDELHRALRLPKVDAGTDADFDVHFGTQKSPIFLLGSSASNAAKFFASSSDAIRLVEIQKLHKEKLAEAQREKGRLENESKQLDTELGLLEPVVELDRQLERVEQAFDELSQHDARVLAAARCQAALEVQTLQFAHHSAETDALSRLAAPPEFAATEPLERLIQSLLAAQHKQDQALALSAALTALAEPPTLHELARVERLIDGLATAALRVARGIDEGQVLSHLAAPPVLNDTDALASLSQRLTTLERDQALANHKCLALAALAAPPEFAHEAPLAALAASLSTATASATQWQATVDTLSPVVPPPVAVDVLAFAEDVRRFEQADRQLRSSQEDLAAAAAALAACGEELRAAAQGQTCAICGSPFDPDRVVARAAVGMKEHDHG
jgi:exonuclease SbcC